MKYLSLLIIIAVLSSCEQTVEDVELPYVEQLVVEAYLEHNVPVDTIAITKTLPPLDNYRRENAVVSDLEGEIIDGQGNTYPLEYLGNSYYAVPSLTPQIGKSYDLFITWKDKVYKSSTYVPDTCKINKVDHEIIISETSYGDLEYEVNIFANVQRNDISVYEAYTYGSKDDLFYSTRFLTSESDSLNDGSLNVRLNKFYYYERPGEPVDTNNVLDLFIGQTYDIITYDPAYEAFYRSRNEGDSGDDLFGISGVNIQGNIENGIGIFIGRSRVSSTISDQ